MQFRVIVVVLLGILTAAAAFPSPFFNLLFGASTSQHQGRQHHGRSYGDDGGNERYKSICRIHAVDTLAYPGRVGNPVCPY